MTVEELFAGEVITMSNEAAAFSLSAPDRAVIHATLLDRRRRLRELAPEAPPHRLVSLLSEVDAALDHLEEGGYGRCAQCAGEVEASRLLCDPLATVCLDCLSAGERRVLERDLARATEVQARLLPPVDLDAAGWQGRYAYRPQGAVGGDYVDVLAPDGPSGDLLVMVGDVAGKGVAAALVMAHLQAAVRATARSRVPVVEMFATTNRLLFESTSTSAYATLVAARLGRDGSVELCTAGHAPPILVTAAGSLPITAGGLPLGLFPEAEFASRRLTVDPGESLLMYTDGLSESLDPSGREFGTEGVRMAIGGRGTASPAELVEAAVAAAAAHRGGGPAHDDLTVLAVTRRDAC